MKEGKQVKKFKLFIDMEKEEKWLNEQLKNGYRCTNISALGIYTFEKTNKNYVIRIDCQNVSNKKISEYKSIYEDFGWDYLKGSAFSGKRYWQKEENSHNEIFSDRQSKSFYYKRLMNYSFWLGLLCLVYSSMLYKDSHLYHEGLWEMNGALFWKAFLFETPFVLLKLLPLFLFLLFSMSYLRSYRKYSMLKDM